MADHAINWRKFEEFCRAFVSKLPGVVFCNHYGKQGNKQRGIDLVATMRDGSKVTYQCRQWAKFSRTDVKEAIKKTTYRAARHVILTSAEVDTGARDEIEKRRTWELWDIADVSQKVRELSQQDARTIVTLNFGAAWCRAFLRTGSVAAFQSSDVSLAPLLDFKRPFNHSHKLIARDSAIQRLLDFAASVSERVVILSGAGGVGKTRILLEVDRRICADIPKYQVLRVEEGVPLTEAALDQLPAGPCFLVVDDAHRRNDISFLLSILSQRSNMKLVLATRAHAVGRLENEIRRAKFGTAEVAAPVAVGNLTYDDTLALVRSILGDRSDPSQIDTRITRVADGSPLVATIAAALVRDRAISPELVHEDAAFAQDVFSKFEDALLGDFTSDPDERRLARALLPVIAALAPLSMRDDAIVETIANYLGATPSAVRLTMSSMESAGILARQGDAIRITPDVLADHILTTKSVTPDGEATGYASELVARFGAIRMQALLRNFAELDWRIRHTRGNARSGVEDIWRVFEGRFHDGEADVRDTLLDILEDVAYYQPARALALIKPLILAAPSAPPVPHGLVDRYVRILLRIAYTIDQLRDAVELLLHLGQSEQRRANDKGAIHTLTELAGYDLYKPLVVQEVILDVVEESLAKNAALLEIALEATRPMLAKTGTNTTSDKRQITFRTFSVSCENVAPMRLRIRRIFDAALSSQQSAIVHRATAILCEDVQEPMGQFGQQISDKEGESWLPERLAALALIERAMAASSDPVFRLAVRGGLKWHARHGPRGPIRAKAKALLDAIPDDFEQRLTRVLHGNALDNTGEEFDYKADLEAFEKAATAVANEYMAATPNSLEGSDDLERRLGRIAQWQPPNPSTFFETMARLAPSYAVGILRRGLESQSAWIVGQLPAFLVRVRKVQPVEAECIVNAAMRGPTHAREALARALAGSAQDVADYEREAWGLLLRDEQQEVRLSALRSLRSLAWSRPREALALALAARFDGDNNRSAALVDELFGLLHSIDDGIVDEGIQALLDIVGQANSLGGYWIREFIGRAARRRPADVFRMLINRIEMEGRSTDRFEALPSEGLHKELSHLRGSPDYEATLRETIELGAKPEHFYRASKLFADVARLDMTTTDKVLRARMASCKSADIEYVASLVAALPNSILMDHTALILSVLQAANTEGAKCFEHVEATLRYALVPTRWESTVGKPDPKLVNAKTKAAEIARSLPEGALERDFFNAVAVSIENRIATHLKSDQEWLDG